jgi:hypothetical protein
MEIQYKLALAGAPTSANLTLNMPTGYTIDTAKLSSTTFPQVGQGAVYDSSATATYNLQYLYNGSNTFLAVYQNNASGLQGAVTQALPVTFAVSDQVTAFIRVPITGWSSNTVMSADSDTRVIALGTAFQTPTGTLSSAFNVVKFGTISTDTAAGYSTSTGLYTCPVTGIYSIGGSLEVTGTYTAAQNTRAVVFKNGSTQLGSGVYTAVGSETATVHTVTVPTIQVQCNAGDTLGLYSWTNATSVTYTSTLSGSTLSIQRLTGPAVVAASESVNARYYNTATAISGSLATISWTTKDFDSHNQMSSGTYTVPVTGKIQVSFSLALTAVSAAAGNAVVVQIQKNGTAVSDFTSVYQNTQTTLSVTGSDIISCVAGDTLRIQVSSAATTPSITSSNTKNFISLARVGN